MLTRAELDRLQRARILDAVTHVVAERGYAETTVGDIVGHGGISRRTFYELFANKADAFFAAYDALVDRAIRRMRAACGGDRVADRCVFVGFDALVQLADLHPAWARVCVFEAPAASLVVGDRSRHLRPLTRWVTDVHRDLRLDLGLDPAEHAGMVIGGLQAAMVTGAGDRRALARGFYRLTVGHDPPPLDPPPLRDGDPRRAAAIAAALGPPPDVRAALDHVVDAVEDHDAWALAAADEAIGGALERAGAPRVELLLLRHVVRAARDGGPLGVLAAIGYGHPGDTAGLAALRCLYQLADRPGLSGRELAELLGLREPRVSRLLAQVRERRFVVARRGAGARKEWYLTAAGRAALRLGDGERRVA